MPSVWVEIVPEGWSRTHELETQLYEVLYEGFGVAADGPWRHTGEPGVLAVALGEDGGIFGSARMLAGEGHERQLRQLAVAPRARGLGLGRSLVGVLEEAAAREGATSVWLNARDSAYGFYQALGYEFDGESFTSELTGIPHRRMSKPVSGWRCVMCRPRRDGIWVAAPE